MSITAYHFWSPTCGPCKVIKPAVQDLKEEFDQINWISVNIQDDPQNYTGEFDVKVVPTIVVLSRDSNGKIQYVGKESGTAMASYYRLIRSGLRFIS
jgi:thiol-disulfide isomerase/thioredoxin